MYKNIYFDYVGVLLHRLYLELMVRGVFLEYNKICMVILVYMLKSAKV